jgi:hypothetical protein
MTADDARNALPAGGRRGAATALAIAGLVTLLGSMGPWALCTTTGCDGFLQSFSEQSGIEFGHGIVTAIAAILLVAIGIDALRRHGVTPWGMPATLLALLVVVTFIAFVIGVYVFADGSLHLSDGGPSLGAYLAGFGGVIALLASLRLQRASRSSPKVLQ